jgi:hypothetical protein
LANWALKQLEKILGNFDPEEMKGFLAQHLESEPAVIEVEFSNILDMTNQQTKTFLHSLLTRKSKIDAHIKKTRKKLEDEARKKNQQKKKQKLENLNTADREMCHCQGLVHDLVSNCIGCGRIICVEEGEGDCLF